MTYETKDVLAAIEKMAEATECLSDAAKPIAKYKGGIPQECVADAWHALRLARIRLNDYFATNHAEMEGAA